MYVFLYTYIYIYPECSDAMDRIDTVSCVFKQLLGWASQSQPYLPSSMTVVMSPLIVGREAGQDYATSEHDRPGLQGRCHDAAPLWVVKIFCCSVGLCPPGGLSGCKHDQTLNFIQLHSIGCLMMKPEVVKPSLHHVAPVWKENCNHWHYSVPPPSCSVLRRGSL